MNKKTSVLAFRVTPEILLALKEAATKRGITVSEWVHETLLLKMGLAR